MRRHGNHCKNRDFMHIELTKIKEDWEWVYYKFNANVLVGTYYNDKGKRRGKVEDKHCYCKLNKLTEEFALDSEKTDSFFLCKKRREVTMVYVRLLRYKRNNLDFPEFIEIATG